MGKVSRGGHLFDALWLLAWGLASSFWCLTAARAVGVTFDEPVYMARGLEHWRTGSHQALLKLGTMPLPIDVDTLPLYLWERWQRTMLDPVHDLGRFLPWARAGTLVFWWLLLFYGLLAGRDLAGPWGGRLAVALLACEPSLLAHASLATTDVAVSACLLALVYHFRIGRHAGWVRRVAVPAGWFAAAVLAKASGLVFGVLCLLVVELAISDRPWMVLLGPWRTVLQPLRRGWHAFAALPMTAYFRRELGPRKHGTQRGTQPWDSSPSDCPLRFWSDLAGIVGIGLVLVFVYCGCDWQPEPSFVDWAQQLPEGPARRTMVSLAENLCIFSNAGEGIARQVKHNLKGHAVFLLGEWRTRAFWYYFPLALSIKLSIPVLLAPVVLLLLRPRALGNWACLTAAVLLAFSLTCRVQIGIRLVLPLVVLAVVGLAAAVVNACRDRASGARLGTVLLAGGAAVGVAWMAWAAVRVWPHGLCYTNEFWGGTAEGYHYLSDSNYDWGQGLQELARWQRRQGLASLDVWYFGTDPVLRKMPVREMPLHNLPLKSPADVLTQVRGHYLAVGTTMLYGSLFGDDGKAHGVALEFLRRQQPVARTTTFFIYDFTDAARPDHRITARIKTTDPVRARRHGGVRCVPIGEE